MAAGLNSSPNKRMQGKARVAMAGLVITIAQRKGGAGKTTLATQLAVAWARCGARVAALDGGLPPPTAFDFSWMRSGAWSHRFVICAEAVVNELVFLIYGSRFAKL